MSNDSRNLFEKLVQRGQQLEKDTKEFVNAANQKISSQSVNLSDLSSQVNRNLNDIRKKFSDRLGLPEFATRADLERLERKVDVLSAKLVKLEDKPSAPTRRRKSSGTKPVGSRSKAPRAKQKKTT